MNIPSQKSAPKRMILVGALSVAVVSILFYISIFSDNLTSVAKTYYIPFASDSLQIKVPELTTENVYKELIKHGVKEPEIVLKQSILETGWYKCTYCSMAQNNIFGFRKNKKYIQFDNWVAGVAYYKQWQDTNYKKGNYYTFLTNIGYATSTEYIAKLKSVKLDFDIDAIPHHNQLKTFVLAFVDYMNERQLD